MTGALHTFGQIRRCQIHRDFFSADAKSAEFFFSADTKSAETFFSADTKSAEIFFLQIHLTKSAEIFGLF